MCIDPGHGGPDPGAVGNGLYESDVVLAVGQLCAAAIRSLDVNVSLTRTQDVLLLPANRTAAIIKPSTCVISIHANAAVSSSARGHEVFVSAYLPESRKLGESISRELTNRVPQIPPRPIPVLTRLRDDGEDFYYVVNEPRKRGIPAVLVELGFITNAADAAVMGNFWGRFALAHAIARGVLTWSGDDVSRLYDDLGGCHQNLTDLQGRLQSIAELVRCWQ